MSEVWPTVEYLFGEIKTFKLVDFTSQLKIDLSYAGGTYLVYDILENAKTCLYGNKSDDVFKTNPISYILLLSRDENLWNPEETSRFLAAL